MYVFYVLCPGLAVSVAVAVAVNAYIHIGSRFRLITVNHFPGPGRILQYEVKKQKCSKDNRELTKKNTCVFQRTHVCSKEHMCVLWNICVFFQKNVFKSVLFCQVVIWFG